MEYLQIKRKIILDLLEKYPDTPTRTLARIAKRDFSEFFKDIEDARLILRQYRGQQGDYKRESVKMRKYYTPKLEK